MTDKITAEVQKNLADIQVGDYVLISCQGTQKIRCVRSITKTQF